MRDLKGGGEASPGRKKRNVWFGFICKRNIKRNKNRGGERKVWGVGRSQAETQHRARGGENRRDNEHVGVTNGRLTVNLREKKKRGTGELSG